MAATQKSPKKRPASSQGGPTPKKPHFTKSTKGKEPAEKKRSRPITAPIEEVESVSEDGFEDIGEEMDDVVLEDDVPGDEMEVDASTTTPKDPNASRESHKAQKAIQATRRAQKPHSSLLTNAKSIWSLARQKNIPSAERQKHIKDLMDVMRGKVKDIVFKHDASRIVQTVVKWGGQKERDEIATELTGSYKELAQNKYSKFLVTKLIRLCPSHRASILLEFQSSVLRLLLHREASSVLADAFELYANAYERTILLRDFYGKETALFSLTVGSEVDKDRAKRGLRGVLEGLEGERRKRVLASVRENLVMIFNNPDKGAITHAIVHRALWEYLLAVNEISDDAEREKLRREMFETCQDALAEMVHTKDGSRVVREFIAQGSAKDRKHIVKVLKPHVERMCTDDEAQLVLFTALDVIDDTKMTAKSLISPLTSAASTLTTTPQGRRALFYLLVPRTRRHFTPAQIVTLSETDEVRARTSKKDANVREDELRKAASEELLQFVVEEGAKVSRETGGSLVVTEIMLYADGDKKAAMDALLQPLAARYPSQDPAAPHPVDLPHTSRMYKTLLQGGHFSHTAHTITRSPAFSPLGFALSFISIVGAESTVAMAGGDGAFLVAELLERMNEEGGDYEKTVLKGWFGKDVQTVLGAEDRKGRTRATKVTPNLKARIPSYLLSLSLSPALHAEHQSLHKKPHYTSSAQLTAQHSVVDLEGANLLTVINFPRKQIGPKMSDCLVTGVLPLGVNPDVKRANTVYVKPWIWDGMMGVEPGAKIGLIPGDDMNAIRESNPRDLTWEEFTKIQVYVGTVLSCHIGEATRGPNLQQVKIDLDCGNVVGKKSAILWLRTPFLDVVQLVGRQLLAVTNLGLDNAAEWYGEGTAAVLTVNGRTILEPAKPVENGFCLA
ncbi:hypothetical protein HWV62_3374 [Athelia sp. TMB]|nr:hypothetical protein HWV62_3374 [Athelia sp. TMB]